MYTQHGRTSHAVICRLPDSNSNTCKSESTSEGKESLCMKIPLVVPPEVSWVKIVWEETTPRSAVKGNEFWNFIVIARAVWNQSGTEETEREKPVDLAIYKVLLGSPMMQNGHSSDEYQFRQPDLSQPYIKRYTLTGWANSAWNLGTIGNQC